MFEERHSARLSAPALTTSLLLLVISLMPSTAVGQPAEIAESARDQIGALLAEKSARTPAQRKINSRILTALRADRGDALAVPNLRTGVDLESDGRVLFDLDATVSAALLDRIEALGGTIVSQFEQFNAVRALLPLESIETLAAEAAIRNVRPADRPLRHGGFVRGNSVITEGDVAHRADDARANFGVDGSGVQVCAMSDSVDELAALIASGELPPGTTFLAGQSGNPGTSEGTALLEIIHDLAPGATLLFATGQGGLAQMAQNILDLATAGCDVIVDDIGYFAEGVFQDDVIAQAVETVVSQGVLYFSSAGNSGNFNDGEAGVFEGDFSGSSFLLPAPLNVSVTAHDYGASQHTNTVTEDPLNDAPFFTLQWSDPLLASGNDYDLFLLDPAMANVLDASTDIQDGNDDPFEDINSVGFDDTGTHLVVVRTSGINRHFHLNSHRARLQIGTNGQIFGHAAAVNAFAVAAVRVPVGNGEFDGTEEVETFSSDGPRRIFFEANGCPVESPSGPGLENGCFAPSEGVQTSIVRQKPDVSAADGVSTTSSNFLTFFGTSASAPHAAAISALLRELDPSIGTSGLRGLFGSSSLDIEEFGFDRDSGAGIIDANSLLEHDNIFSDGFESGNTSAWTNSVP